MEATDDGQRRWKLQTMAATFEWTAAMEATDDGRYIRMDSGDGSYRRWAEAMEATDDGQKRWKLQTTEATDEWTEAMEATDD